MAPGSLSVGAQVSSSDGVAIVNSLNFSRNRTALSDKEALRAVDLAEVSYGQLFDMSPGLGSPGYDHPSSKATAVVYQTTYGGGIASAISPCGANCTFTQSFVGPSYRCEQLDQYDSTAPWCQADSRHSCEDVVGDFGLTDPKSVTSYLAGNSSGDFCAKYLPDHSGGCPWGPGNTEAWMDGVIWVFHRYLPSEYRAGYNFTSITNPTIPGSAWQNYTFRCTQWDTRFDIRRTYFDSEQRIEGQSYQFISGYVGTPTQWASYAIHQTLYSILKGRIGVTARGNPENTAGLEGTKLVEDTPFPVEAGIRRPLPNLRELIQELSTNVTLSLLSIDGLIYQQPQPDTAVTRTSYANVFHYNKRALLLTYGIACLAGLVALAIGLQSYYSNGVSMGSGFLAILATTRNRRLDELAGGACLGADPMPEELRKVKVRFGDLGEGGVVGGYGNQPVADPFQTPTATGGAGVKHAGFGIEGEVQDIEYRTPYY
ncbi:hypothetical protein FGG08_002286 [Glutinoglossum americanum]|uniref:Uncharacterized protein n=1 Tax=Glutinoglossum americanum TaxID=1670608 RepID=A0A9P8KZD1_9PEZI|nr:hypothetical protein FGG08_002286 [Glutinoglossum americanum]